MSFLISHVPPAHSSFQKTSILENTAKSLPTYFLTLTKVANINVFEIQDKTIADIQNDREEARKTIMKLINGDVD